MVLGVIFFIGGQWIGLSLSEEERVQNSLKDAQNGGASPAVGDFEKPLLKTGPPQPQPSVKPQQKGSFDNKQGIDVKAESGTDQTKKP